VRDDALVRAGTPDARAAIQEPPKPTPAASPTLRARILAKGTQRPLAGIRISVDGAGTTSQSKESDTDGRAEFAVAAGVAWSVWARDEKHVAGSAALQVPALAEGEVREVLLELPSGDDLRFCGLVLAREGRQPIAGARVHVEARAMPMPEGATIDFTTDADGSFEVELASWRLPDLSVRAPGFGPAIVVPRVGHETPESAIVVLLDRSASLIVHLLGAAGAPIAGARVRATTGSENILRPDSAELLSMIGIPDPDWSAETDAQGACTIADLPPDAPLHLEATRERRTLRRETEPLTLRAGETRTIEWRIGSGCRLSGRITDASGAPVEGLALWLLRAESSTPEFLNSYAERRVVKRARSGADGVYAIDDLAAGNWCIGPAPTRGFHEPPSADAVAPLAVVVEIPEGAADVRKDLVVHRGLYIRGRVLDPSGAPLPGASVLGSSEEIKLHDSASAGAEGAFALGPLASGRYRLTAVGHGEHGDSDTVLASAGDDGVVLQVKVGALLAGTVVDARSGAPCPARLTVTGLTLDPPLMMLAETQADGTFALAGMRPGTYDIAAHTDDARVGIVRGVVITGGVQDAGPVLRVSAGARVRVRYDGKARYGTFEVRSDGAIVGIDSLESGTSRSQPVPAGRVVVKFTLWDPTRTQEKELELAVGEEKSCAFTDTP
jgi:hypothetical protein